MEEHKTATIYYNNDTEFDWRYIEIGGKYHQKGNDGKINPFVFLGPPAEMSLFKKITLNETDDGDFTSSFEALVAAANRKMAWLKTRAEHLVPPLVGPLAGDISGFDNPVDGTKSADVESSATLTPGSSTSSTVSHTDTGYHITKWLKKYEGNINHYADRVSHYTLRDDYTGFKKEIRGLPHNVKVNDNGTFESDFIHADSPLAASISANVFILAIQTYGVIYTKTGNSPAALPEGDILFKLNPRDLDPRHRRVFDEFSADVEKRVLTWVKNRPEKFPQEVLSKFKFVRPDGSKIDINPKTTPKDTAKKDEGLRIRKKAPSAPAPDVDSSSSDSDHEKSPSSSPRSRSGSF